MKRYRVFRDYQGGSFGMDRDYTAMEWLEQMLEWSEADGVDDNELYAMREYWTDEIEFGREQRLIDNIAEVWQLEFEEIKDEEDSGTDI